MQARKDVSRDLQALVEYEYGSSVARIMGWSDEWNSRVKLAWRHRNGTANLGSYYRVWRDPDTTTEVIITNAGHKDYAETAAVALTWYGKSGVTGGSQLSIARMPLSGQRLMSFAKMLTAFWKALIWACCESTVIATWPSYR